MTHLIEPVHGDGWLHSLASVASGASERADGDAPADPGAVEAHPCLYRSEGFAEDLDESYAAY